MNLPFFVYGTLKPGEPNYVRYLTGHTTAEIAAHLASAAMFTQGPYPFLTRESDLVLPEAVVYGSLITVRLPVYELVLADLDRLEGYVGGGSANLYERVTLEVMTAAGPQTAWVYLAGNHALALIRSGQMRPVAGGNW
ncbi:MAG: gamma-glutamylcyclotransferase [Candidatus Viridilinea halotolerans]|uniref:Gamma-glutamylcyclotransferase n=1 Tax=Candidatus Viridilinea halotolerans TaxID=2491704 RepID=A0A426U395_9CHLR|nr:MAG: gamma-glutamylcyclotransferase [Candidatus Viridilinea halotolerans]